MTTHASSSSAFAVLPEYVSWPSHRQQSNVTPHNPNSSSRSHSQHSAHSQPHASKTTYSFSIQHNIAHCSQCLACLLTACFCTCLPHSLYAVVIIMFDASLQHCMCGVHHTTSCADLAMNHGGMSNVMYTPQHLVSCPPKAIGSKQERENGTILPNQPCYQVS